MKGRHFYCTVVISLLAVIIMSNCSNELEVSIESPENVSSYRTLDEAIAIAEASQVMLYNHGTLSTRATNADFVNRFVDREHSFSVGKNVTRSSGGTDGILYYVINFCDSMGFAIVPASKNVEDILAITERGHYDGETESEIGGFNDFMDMAVDFIINIDSNRVVPPVPPSLSDTVWSCDNHLIDTKWNQQGVTGAYCPNGIAGCVPLAVAEILSYHKYPNSIELSYQGADMATQNLDWEEINKHVIQSSSCVASDSAHNALGRLCRQLGQLMNSSYDSGSTGTYRANVPNCFTTLGYNVIGWRDYSTNCCVTPISNFHPVIVAGFRNTTSGTSGHEWLVDGFIKRTITTGKYVVREDGISHWEPKTYVTVYNHVNWGWGGNYNGYYCDGVFDTSNYHTLDSGTTTSTMNRNYNIYVQYLEAYR